MQVFGIDHIGIAVRNIDEAMDFYRRALGLKLSGREDLPERHLKVGFIETGDVKLELIESTSDDSAIAGFLAAKGGGIHHICLKVDNLAETLKHLQKEDFKLIDSKPRAGAQGSKIAFVHPNSANGVLIELKELPK